MLNRKQSHKLPFPKFLIRSAWLLISIFVIAFSPATTSYGSSDFDIDRTLQEEIFFSCTENLTPNKAYLLKPAVIGDQAFLILFNAESGKYEIWKSDGTTSGTEKRTALPDFQDVQFSGITINNRLIFTGETIVNHYGLYSSDAYASPELLYGNDTHGGEVYGGYYYFYVYNNFTDQLWRTDGTFAGTEMIRAFDSAMYWSELPYFFLTGETDQGLWYLDDNNLEVRHLNSDSEYYDSSVEPLNADKALIANNLLDGTVNILVTDGTDAGTSLLKAIPQKNFYKAGHSDQYTFFQISLSLNSNWRTLWQSDGTVDGTFEIDPTFQIDDIENSFNNGDAMLAMVDNGSDHLIIQVSGADGGSIDVLAESENAWRSYNPFVPFQGKVFYLDTLGGTATLFSIENRVVSPLTASTVSFYDANELRSSRYGWLTFLGKDGDNRSTMYISDGTAAGIRPVFTLPQTDAAIQTFDSQSGNKVFIWASFDDPSTLMTRHHFYACQVFSQKVYLPLLIH